MTTPTIDPFLGRHIRNLAEAYDQWLEALVAKDDKAAALAHLSMKHSAEHIQADFLGQEPQPIYLIIELHHGEVTVAHPFTSKKARDSKMAWIEKPPINKDYEYLACDLVIGASE